MSSPNVFVVPSITARVIEHVLMSSEQVDHDIGDYERVLGVPGCLYSSLMQTCKAFETLLKRKYFSRDTPKQDLLLVVWLRYFSTQDVPLLRGLGSSLIPMARVHTPVYLSINLNKSHPISSWFDLFMANRPVRFFDLIDVWGVKMICDQAVAEEPVETIHPVQVRDILARTKLRTLELHNIQTQWLNNSSRLRSIFEDKWPSLHRLVIHYEGPPPRYMSISPDVDEEISKR